MEEDIGLRWPAARDQPSVSSFALPGTPGAQSCAASRAESFHTAVDAPTSFASQLNSLGSVRSRTGGSEDAFFESTDLLWAPLPRAVTAPATLSPHAASARSPAQRQPRCRGLRSICFAALLLLLVSAARGKFDSLDTSVLSEDGPMSVLSTIVADDLEPAGDLQHGQATPRRRRLMRLAAVAVGVTALSYSTTPPGGQIASSVALGALHAGRAGAALAGKVGGIVGALLGAVLGSAGAVVVCELLAPVAAQVMQVVSRGSKACACVGYVSIAVLPALWLLVALLRLC